MSHTDNSTCAVCPATLPPRARTGRPALYCSRACQAKAYRARATERQREPNTASVARVVRLPKPTGDGGASDRILSLTVALVHRAELAAGAIRNGRPVPDGANGLDAAPDTIERIAADLVGAIRSADPGRRDESVCQSAPSPQPPEPAPVVGTARTASPTRSRRPLAVAAATTTRRVETSRVETPEPPADEPAERVIRTVDMSADLGDGYALVQLESTFDGEWLLRRHGETIGSVTRVSSLSGYTVTGWEARHHTMKLPYGLRGSWRTRAMAAAGVATAHERHCLKPQPKGRRRRQSRAA
ncbi:hypothetical protein ACWDSL_35440 [Streptomyces sp. NPDC000941]